MNLFHLIKDFRIRYKLLFIYSATFIVIISLGSLIIYSTVKKIVVANVESELKNSTIAIQNMVRTSVSVSIKNHLRAAAEKNHDIIKYLYESYQKGELTEKEAKKRAADIILCQKIGTTGYICIISTKGKVLKHPKLPEGQDVSMHGFIQEMISKKNGYIEYYWKNPEEKRTRPKALYVMLFEPWDWFITVSSYRKEFQKLVNINDFKESVLNLKFGKTGYAYVMDTTGNIIIHPELEGLNILTAQGIPNYFFKDMLEKKNGKLVYYWKNFDHQSFRKKLVIFNHIPEYNWIVASSSYLDEFYSPMKSIRNFIVFIAFASLLIFVPITFFLSSTITRPLHDLMNRFNQDIIHGFSNRLVKMESRDEVGQLTFYYNSFMDKLEKYNIDLQDQIREKQEAQEALKISEEKYRSVMEATPDPIVVYDMDGKVTYLNPAFTTVFGWTLTECRGQNMDRFVPKEHWNETNKGICMIEKGEILSNTETKRLTKFGELIDISVRGSVYKNKKGESIGSIITHRDVSLVKRLEKIIMETGEKERQKIGNDLHDDLCPHLIGIEGLSRVLFRKIDSKGAGAAILCRQVTDLIKEAVIKTRRLARGLCPVYFNHGLEASLQELVSNTRNLYQVVCTLKIRGDIKIKDNFVITHIYHITQEAVHNAIKHGKASIIDILVVSGFKKLQITIIDNGIGIQHAAGTDGMGLRIMQYRAKMINGSFAIDDNKDAGTIVKINLPLFIAQDKFK